MITNTDVDSANTFAAKLVASNSTANTGVDKKLMIDNRI
jgi:hypothetical protein